MNLIEIVRTTTFRLAFAFACFFAGASLLLFGFIYWSTAIFETGRIDRLIVNDARIIANEPADVMLGLVTTRVTNDFHRVSYAGLFDAQGHRIAGNLSRLPADLPPDGNVHSTRVAPLELSGVSEETVRAVARLLPGGGYLVIGRNIELLERLKDVVFRALALGVVPLMLFSLAAGGFLSWRAQKRIKDVHHAAERIRLGQLRERLPTRGGRDDFDRLALSVNRMLDEIERLLNEIRATGDEIAHDLRTPLTRVRARLERALDPARSHDELKDAINKAIIGLDQALTIITALLRIREIEAGQRRSGFSEVDLQAIVLSIAELYQPIAEEKGVRFEVISRALNPVRGDRDLLMEAVGNLVDNAIKFTPRGGSVQLSLLERGADQVIRIGDTGPGVAPQEREMIFARFYRSERTRQVAGTGLGLSLVAAIAKLHNIGVSIEDNNPGCVVDLVFETPAWQRPHATLGISG